MEINNIDVKQTAVQSMGGGGQATAATEQSMQSMDRSQTAGQSTPEKLNDAVSVANDIAKLLYNTQLNFSIDNTTKQVIVKVVDSNSGEVIRQMPPDEMLRLIAHFDKIQALLFSQKY
jgi:flagellar protein FlaG